MTYGDIIRSMNDKDLAEFLRNCVIPDNENKLILDLINSLEQQPRDECVSRQAVKEGMIKYGFRAPDMTITEFIEDELPPVTPTFPEGVTNGDVIKTVFSSYKFSDDFGWINIVLNGRSCSFCSAEFWNAPYKGVEND